MTDKAVSATLSLHTFFLVVQKESVKGFPPVLLGAGFFGYFFFVAVDKEKVTFQPQMLWFNDWPIKQRRRLFFRFTFFWLVKRKVTMGFSFGKLMARIRTTF